MSPVVEQLLTIPHELIEVDRVELRKSAPQHQRLGACDHVDRIYLNATDTLDHIPHGIGRGGRSITFQHL
jgi:hypothetical protein